MLVLFPSEVSFPAENGAGRKLTAAGNPPVCGRMYGRKEKELGIVTEKASIWKYIAIIVMFAVMALGLNNLIFLSDLSAASETYSDTMQTLYGQGFAVQILVLGILMPTCEELVYRGLVYKRLRYTSPFWAAALYSSLVFAFTHGNLVQGL